MEAKFVALWLDCQKKAALLGVRMRSVTPEKAMESAHRCLSGHRESEGFFQLADQNRLDLSLEALAVKKEFTSLFSDEEANHALDRLLSAGYRF